MMRMSAPETKGNRLLVAGLVGMIFLAACARHVVVEREASAGLNADEWTIHSEPEER